jgi:hypothetical protein
MGYTSGRLYALLDAVAYVIHYIFIQYIIEIGVYNPVSKKEILTSFKTTTPRTVTVCLDLNENVLKFWLNDRRNSNKNMKLPLNDTSDNSGLSGPWIPCVKLSKEMNKVVLNPFAREPSDFYEKDFDKKFTITKYVMPYLYNMILIQNYAIQNGSIKDTV